MLRLSDIFLQDEYAEELIRKQEQYNKDHPDDPLNVQGMAKLFLEYGIKYLDVSAID